MYKTVYCLYKTQLLYANEIGSDSNSSHSNREKKKKKKKHTTQSENPVIMFARVRTSQGHSANRFKMPVCLLLEN